MRLSKLPSIIQNKIMLPRPKTANYFCPVCSSSVICFERLPDSYYKELDRNEFIFSIFQFETLNYLSYLCPNCGSSDRDRLYATYLTNNPPICKRSQKAKFLDIAPSKALQRCIKTRFPKLEYKSADLSLPGVDDIIDITRMDAYEDDIYDFFICSHVLEHVTDDQKAMKELYRVLKPGGKGIAMVPIMLSLDKDFENTEVVSSDDRWKYFGQDDHVRMYSKPGFVGKLTSSGFLVSQLGIDAFGMETFEKHGIHPRSVLYLVEKPSNASKVVNHS
jgi:SAM-dependent methyltransferase